MNKRQTFSTIPSVVKNEIVPVLIHDPNAGIDEAQYAYAAFSTTDMSFNSNQGHHQGLVGSQEVIIDENGQAVTFQELVDSTQVEQLETVESEDGTHTILHFIPDGIDEEDVIEVDDGEQILDEMHEEYEEQDQNIHSEAIGIRSKTFYCPNCGNCYSAAGSLKLHMRACLRQRQEIPIEDRKCNICDKVFNSVNYLKEHMLRHSGNGPRRCTRCYRKFIDEDKYNAHLEMHKQQEKLEAEAEALAAQHGGKKIVVKEFTCSFCAQNFTVVFEAGQVKRRYACDTCREKYSNAEMLKKHKQEIEDKREFSCERCGRKFVFEGFLQRHLPNCDGTIKRRRDVK